MDTIFQILYDKQSFVLKFKKAKAPYNKEICKYPLLRELDIFRQQYLKYDSKSNLKEKLQLLSNTLRSSEDLPLPKWIFEYKEIQKLFGNYIVKKSFLSVSKVDISSIISPTRSVRVQGILKRVLIVADAVDFESQTITLNTVLVRFKNISNYMHIGSVCKNDVFLVDLRRQVLLKNDSKSISRIYETLRIPKTSGYHLKDITISFKSIKTLIDKFKDSDFVMLQTIDGKSIEFVEISELIKDPDNKRFVSKIADAYNKGKYYFEYNEIYYVFDKKEYERLEKQILLFLSDKDIKEIREVFEKAASVPKTANKELIEQLYKKGFKAKLDPPQEVGVSWLYGLYKAGVPGAILGDEMGLGKGLTEDTKILTVTGFKPIKDLQINERIYTESFEICEVQGIYLQGEQEIYTFLFEDGRTIQTDKEHLWKVRIDNTTTEVLNTEKLYDLLKNDITIEIPLVQNRHFDSGVYNIEELNLAITFHDIKSYITKYGHCKSDYIQCVIPKEELKCSIDDFIRSLYSIGCVVTYDENDLEYIVKIQRYRYDTLFIDEAPLNLPEPKYYLQIKSITRERQRKNTICIKVDNPTKLYIAENYIVTHNTVQAIGFLTLTNARKIAVIAPASMVEVWKSEIKKFYPPLLKYVDVYSYESVGRSGLPTDYTIIVLDEGQKVKNPATLAATVLRNTQAKFKLVMTGTPIENSVKDLFSLILVILPHSNRFLSILYTKMANKDQLKAVELTRKLIDGFYLGRKKSKDTVPTSFSIINEKFSLSDTEQAIYENIVKIYKEKLKNVDSNTLYYNEAIVGLQRLLMCVSNVRQLPDDLIPEGINKNTIIPSKFVKLKTIISRNRSQKEKTIVFAIFKQTIEFLKNELGGNILTITGQTPKSERGNIVDKFQNDPSYDVIIIALQAGATGLTLTAANHVVMYDLWWNPAIEAQAFARAYRRGQTKDVFGYRLVAKDTIDERIVEILNKKLVLIDTFKYEKVNSKAIANQLINQIFK